jgi:hypothetical protein
MIEIFVIWHFASAMHATAKQKGRSGGLWALSLVVTWIGCEVIGAFAVGFVWALVYRSAPNTLLLYVAALACAFTGMYLLGKILDAQPSRNPPPLPRRRQPSPITHAPVAAPAPSMAYHISDGIQRTGPYDLVQLRQLWHAGAVSPESLYWFEGAQDWQPITKLSKLLAV